MNIELVIFDMDGLLIDSERVYILNAKKVLKAYGYQPDVPFLIETIGVSWDITQKMYEEKYPDLDYDEYIDELNRVQGEYLSVHPYKKKKGLSRLLKYLKQQGIRTAVATSTHRRFCEERLRSVGLDNTFDGILCGDELDEGKPSPQIYLKTLAKFNTNKDKALVFEDSKNGLLSAYNAGIRCIIVPDICYIPEDILANAYRVIDDLSQGIDIIEQLQ